MGGSEVVLALHLVQAAGRALELERVVAGRMQLLGPGGGHHQLAAMLVERVDQR